MGIINWLMHRHIKNAAKDIVEWVMERYETSKIDHPEFSEREIFKKILEERGKFPGGEDACNIVLDRYGSSINGICYFMGLNSQKMRGFMVMRSIQFTECVDIELAKYGIQAPTDDIKAIYFKTLGLS